jgi:hypothetical protein
MRSIFFANFGVACVFFLGKKKYDGNFFHFAKRPRTKSRKKNELARFGQGENDARPRSKDYPPSVDQRGPGDPRKMAAESVFLEEAPPGLGVFPMDEG